MEARQRASEGFSIPRSLVDLLRNATAVPGLQDTQGAIFGDDEGIYRDKLGGRNRCDLSLAQALVGN